MTPIQPGESIPHFSLVDQHGNTVTIQNEVGKQNLVIYFYPKDYTPGCTKEACKFRDEFEDFKDTNAMVIGISSDSQQMHQKFADRYRLPFTLLSDPGNKVRKLFGVPSKLMGLLPGRVTFVVDKQGKVVHTFDAQFQAEKHVEEALRILREVD